MEAKAENMCSGQDFPFMTPKRKSVSLTNKASQNIDSRKTYIVLNR